MPPGAINIQAFYHTSISTFFFSDKSDSLFTYLPSRSGGPSKAAGGGPDGCAGPQGGPTAGGGVLAGPGPSGPRSRAVGGQRGPQGHRLHIPARRWRRRVNAPADPCVSISIRTFAGINNLEFRDCAVLSFVVRLWGLIQNGSFASYKMFKSSFTYSYS